MAASEYKLSIVRAVLLQFKRDNNNSPGHGGKPQLRLSTVLLLLHFPIHSLCLVDISSKPHLASQILH